MAGPAVKGTEFMREQRHLITERMGLPESAFRQNEQMVEYMIEVTDRYPYDYVETHLDSLAATVLPAFMRNDTLAVNQIKTGLLQSAVPEMVSLRRYDPAADLACITCPVLALVGEKDVQVPPSVVELPLREGINRLQTSPSRCTRTSTPLPARRNGPACGIRGDRGDPLARSARRYRGMDKTGCRIMPTA